MTGKPNCFCSVSPFTIIIKQPPQEATVELNLMIFMTPELNNLSKATTNKNGTLLFNLMSQIKLNYDQQSQNSW